MLHLVERRSDQAAEANDVDVLLPGCFQDFVARDHHAQVDHLVVIAAQDHADDIFADVVHVPFHCGHEDSALGLHRLARGRQSLLLRFHERGQVGDGFLHDPGRFHHLWQEHLSGAE